MTTHSSITEADLRRFDSCVLVRDPDGFRAALERLVLEHLTMLAGAPPGPSGAPARSGQEGANDQPGAQH